MKKVIAKRISGRTFFKLLLIGSVATHILSVLAVMAVVLFGWFEPTQGGQPISIVQSELYLAIYLVVGIIFMPIWAGVFWLCLYPGIWVYSKFKATNIYYHE